jgi:hypothetical protein
VVDEWIEEAENRNVRIERDVFDIQYEIERKMGRGVLKYANRQCIS